MHDIVHHRSFLAEIRGLIKLIRPKQWVKNSFVFAPLIFAGEFLKIGSVYSALFAAFLFCLAASAVYIVNDLKDIEKDDNSLEYLKSLNIRTVPFVETENDSWLGFNPAKIRALKA